MPSPSVLPSDARDGSADEPSRWPRYARWTAIIVGIALLLLLGFAGALWWLAEQRMDRQAVDALGGDKPAEASETIEELNVLIVGSDSREGLTDEQIRELKLGEFEGKQADTILLVQLRPDDEVANVVSIPRDLRIETTDGREMRINSALARGGADLMVRAIETLAGVAVDHYVEVSIPGFLASVEALGSVEICLDDPLQDRHSGADFSAGCHDMDPEESLSFVRSRAGPRGDFERIERQQTFMAAVLHELTSARILTNPPRLVRLVDHLGRHVTTDEGLSIRDMRRIARELSGVEDGTVRKVAMPAYADSREDVDYVSAYEPGSQALFRQLRQGQPVGDRGEPDERLEVSLGVWTAGLPGAAERVESTLYYAGFEPEILGRGPVEQAHRTVVHAVGEDREPAEWIASVLGAEVKRLGPDHEVPEGTDVIVVVGRDAQEDLPTMNLGTLP
jgi:LCP family protein required for cell wall assembly